MDISLPPGRYVIAVSGGVDSMALLHLLRSKPGVRLTVAHFDHGIRPDSASDRQLVQSVSRQYGLPFVWSRAELGSGASEAVARQKRYEFLRQARQAAAAQSIITAHHQDDKLETAIHNLIRGTGRKGLSSLRSSNGITRPLLGTGKQDILAYARQQGLVWRDDPTNADDAYTRNYIRHRLVPRLPETHRQAMLDNLALLLGRNDRIDAALDGLLRDIGPEGQLERRRFTALPHAVAKELLAYWLRQQGGLEINARMLERLVHAAKTFPPTSCVDAAAGWQLRIGRSRLALRRIER